MLRRKINDSWTDKHRQGTRKEVVEGGWVQKRLYDIGWSDGEKCRGCNKEEGTYKHRLYHSPCWKGGQKPDHRQAGEMGAKVQDFKERSAVVERNHVAPLSEGQWKKSHVTVRRWES